MFSCGDVNSGDPQLKRGYMLLELKLKIFTHQTKLKIVRVV